jgi:hypothetical protein
MERGRFCSDPGIVHAATRVDTHSDTRRRRKCTLKSLLICFFVLVLNLNVPAVRSINFLKTGSRSTRRRPSSSKQRTTRLDDEGEGTKSSSSKKFTLDRRKKAFRFALSLPSSWNFLSQKRQTLLPLQLASALETDSETQPRPQSHPQQLQSSGSEKLGRPPKTVGSVHLQLQELADATTSTTSNPEDDTEEGPQLQELQLPLSVTNTTKHATVKIHTFQDTATGNTWKALNTAKNKFHAFLLHQNLNCTVQRDDIVTQEISLSEDDQSSRELRQEWRDLWKKRQLVTDRTELLAVYPSDKVATAVAASTTAAGSDQGADAPKNKRGGFADLLYLYTERLVSIINDEHVEVEQKLPSSYKYTYRKQQNTRTEESMLMDWLRGTYGKDSTERLRASNLGRLEEKEQLGHLKHFLEWFRSQFPYYYDRCGTCGASMKEDNARCPPPADSRESGGDDDHDDDHDENQDHDPQTFVGYIYPDDGELSGKASRTEIYHCHKCQSFTRFPRFNSVSHVIENHRGRCGEYSMLLYRILRALDHETRWVVDWADHVWAEVALGENQRWVHLDPCEAAVDENLIYQGWGKKQTFILGFYAPRRRGTSNATIGSADPLAFSETTTPIIEDITSSYTDDSWEEICKRRDESEEEIRVTMAKAIGDLAPKLLQVGEER